MRVALIGKMGSGKTTIGDALVRQFNGIRLAFADKLKQDILQFHLTEDGQINKARDRSLLQNYGQLRRNELETLEYYDGKLFTMHGGSSGSLLYNQKRIGGVTTYECLGENHPDYWVEALFNKVKTLTREKIIVVDDVRRWNEAQALKHIKFTTVKINCSEEVRLNRLKARDGTFNLETLSNISETQIDSIPFDLEITNETTLDYVLEKFTKYFN